MSDLAFALSLACGALAMFGFGFAAGVLYVTQKQLSRRIEERKPL